MLRKEAILAAMAGALNPAGLFYVIASALPATLGANAGLLSLPGMMRNWKRHEAEPVGPVPRSNGWIAVTAVACILFMVVLGRGITFTRLTRSRLRKTLSIAANCQNPL